MNAIRRGLAALTRVFSRPEAVAVLARPVQPEPAPEPRPEGLHAEIARLEAETEAIYARIASGHGTAATVAELTARADSLRQKLGQLRSDLARVERCVDRELRLDRALRAKAVARPRTHDLSRTVEDDDEFEIAD